MNCSTNSIVKAMPQISVIVPVYNVEPFLRQCVDSILSQTFQDFELILVDDGSPDNCGKICDEYASKDNRVHVIHQPNGGLSAARNAALDWMFANSASPYLTFIDSDDWVHERYLELLYWQIDKRQLSISACDYAYVSDSTEIKSAIGSKIEALEMTPEHFWCERKRYSELACCKLLETSFFQDLRFPVGKIHEDVILMPQVVFRAKSIKCIDVPIYYYRMRSDSITHTAWSPKELDFCDGMEMQMELFARMGLSEPRRLAVELFMQQMAICHYQSKAYPGLGRSFASNLRKRALRVMETYGKDVNFPICAENYAVLSLLHPVIFPDFLRKLHHFFFRQFHDCPLM